MIKKRNHILIKLTTAITISLMIIANYLSHSAFSDDMKLSAKARNDTDKMKTSSDNNDMRKEIDELKSRLNDLEERVEELNIRTDEKNRLRISGFFDVKVSNYKNKPNIFELGDFELNFEHNYEQERLQVAAALVFNKGAELAVGFIDYHLFGGPIAPRGRLFEKKGIHIQVGKFDVPFGNDWQYFIAINRITVTPPLTTEMVMDGGYNDVGVRFLANFVPFNLSMYMLRGIEQGYSYGGNSYGGRLGITPFSNPYLLKAREIPISELGFSYIYDVDKEGKPSEKMYAADIDNKIGPFMLRSEYYYRDKLVGIIHRGYHVTAALDFNEILSIPIILYSRYDYYNMKRYRVTDEYHTLSRATGGLNIKIASVSYLKLEYLQFIKYYQDYATDYFSKRLYYIQLMITF